MQQVGKPAVSHEMAMQEINGWVEKRRLRRKKREESQDTIELLAEGIRDGYLRVNEAGELEMDLAFPLGSEGNVKKLKFQHRISVGAINRTLEKQKSASIDGRILAYVVALTNQPVELVKQIDSSDWSIIQSVALLFM